MKTTHVESMEELIFKNRNHDYGAYSLRRNYINHVIIAMFIAVLFTGSALTFPLILNHNAVEPVKGDTIIITVTPFRKAADEPLKPPPAPPTSTVNVPKDLAFRVPKVTDEPAENNDFGKQDMIAATSTSPATDPGSVDFGVPSDIKPEPLMPPYEKPEPMTVVEEMPSFPGGANAMVKFIKDHLKYPSEARETNIKGTVYLNFVVEIDGSVTEVSISRAIGGGCEEEAIRVLKSMPDWIPGKQNGRAVRVRLTLPVKFVLND